MTETADRQLKGRKTVLPMTRVKLAEKQDGKPQLEGYAAVFGNRDSYGDVIVKGAFERTLRERPDVKVLWQHDRYQPIGKQIGGTEDDFGLRVQGELSETNLVRGEVVPLLADGVVNGLSIGYDVIEEEYNEDLRTWFLKDIELYEWSPVTFPANDLAVITRVNSLQEAGASMHLDSVGRHARTLVHELSGYFAKDDRREGLDLPLLAKLHGLIGGALPDQEPDKAVDADVKAAYLRGGIDALDLLETTKERT